MSEQYKKLSNYTVKMVIELKRAKYCSSLLKNCTNKNQQGSQLFMGVCMYVFGKFKPQNKMQTIYIKHDWVTMATS